MIAGKGVKMCHRIKIDKERKLAQIIASGRVNGVELKEIFTEVVSHEDWQAGFNMLCDYSKIEIYDVDSQDIYDITDWQTTIDALIGNGKCAVVATRDFIYGMNRMWEFLSSDRSQRIGIFRHMKEAVSWLGCPVPE